MPKDPKTESPIFKANNALPLLFADVTRVSKRSDGMMVMQFAASNPGEFNEQARLIFPTHAARALIDLLCKVFDYYPPKPDDSAAQH
jgi:hypothetical protein